ncbi:hypothetical protein GGH95_005431, partial [Coemansia sp. RSA 1836]
RKRGRCWHVPGEAGEAKGVEKKRQLSALHNGLPTGAATASHCRCFCRQPPDRATQAQAQAPTPTPIIRASAGAQSEGVPGPKAKVRRTRRLRRASGVGSWCPGDPAGAGVWRAGGQ